MSRLVYADQISPDDLNVFITQHFPIPKALFLEKHGSWWHGGDHNRWVILEDDQIAAYCAIIPAKIWTGDRIEQALWWVDIMVSPKFRGQGLQSMFDRQILSRAETKLGFPNELAARIHRKHGWGVREDLEVFLLPLKPFRLNQVKRSRGIRKILINGFALALTLWASWYKQGVRRWKSYTCRIVESPPAEQLARIFERYRQENTTTTYRDEQHFEWRYYDSPYRDQLKFFLKGDDHSPSHYAITRTVEKEKNTEVRILDYFGDFQDQNGFEELFKYIAKDAIQRGATSVKVFCSLPELKNQFRRAGFILRAKIYFCWFSEDRKVSSALAERSQWTLADSDNDDP